MLLEAVVECDVSLDSFIIGGGGGGDNDTGNKYTTETTYIIQKQSLYYD